MDTMGRPIDRAVGMYACHDAGGNQVRILLLLYAVVLNYEPVTTALICLIYMSTLCAIHMCVKTEWF